MARIRHINGNSYLKITGLYAAKGIYKDTILLMRDSRASSNNAERGYWKSEYTHYLLHYKKEKKIVLKFIDLKE